MSQIFDVMMASASPSPKSPEISEKSKKYDRQLRLWGDHGQHRLETSQVCLINANATGTEILKSLVLPGCGNFTIVDGNKVTQEDLGNNFFLDAESLGRNRAEVATRLLLEMNSDVNGTAIEDQPDTIIKQNPNFFNHFSIVIGCMLSETTLVTLSKTLWENNVPFVYVHCTGLIGWLRLQIAEHAVVESHPDSVKEDLRLDAPFPELVQFMKNVKIEEWKQTWVTMLYKAWQSFKLRGDIIEPDDSNEQTFTEYFQNYCVDNAIPVDEALTSTIKNISTIPFHDIFEYIKVASQRESTEAWIPALKTAFEQYSNVQNERRKQEFLNYFRTKYLALINMTEDDADYLEAIKAVDACTYLSLVELMDSISNEKREPWLILLYKAVQSYMTNKGDGNHNGGGMDTTEAPHPCNMSDKKLKQDFKDFLGKYLLALGLEITDEVYEETMKAVNTALTPTTIPYNVQSILNDPKSFKPENKFWIMCAALKEFMRENIGHLPVRGSLPDMTADSQKYIALQTVYREKAGKDAEDIYDRCQQLIKEAGQKITIKPDETRLFCKEVYNLRLIRGQPFFEELQGSPNTILRDLDNMEDCDANKIFYIMFRGILRFHSECKTYPGVMDNEVEPDIARFKSCINKMLTEWNTSTASVKEDYIHEICRYGAAEVPSIAAFMGGCAAQEVIKLITSQYVPLNHTLIYNALHCTTSTFEVL